MNGFVQSILAIRIPTSLIPRDYRTQEMDGYLQYCAVNSASHQMKPCSGNSHAYALMVTVYQEGMHVRTYLFTLMIMQWRPVCIAAELFGVGHSSGRD